MNCAGLSEREKAIIKANTQGSLKFDDVAAAFRSCFPAFKVSSSKAKKLIGALQVDVEEPAASLEAESMNNDRMLKPFWPTMWQTANSLRSLRKRLPRP